MQLADVNGGICVTSIIAFVLNFLLTFLWWWDCGRGLCGGWFSWSLSGCWHWKKQHAYANLFCLVIDHSGSDVWHPHQDYLLTIQTHTNTHMPTQTHTHPHTPEPYRKQSTHVCIHTLMYFQNRNATIFQARGVFSTGSEKINNLINMGECSKMEHKPVYSGKKGK